MTRGRDITPFHVNPVWLGSHAIKLALLLVMLLALSGCGSTISESLTIYDDRSFEISGTITVPQSSASSLGGAAGLNSQLNDTAQRIRQQGGQDVEVDWQPGQAQRSGDLAYTYTAKGKDYAALGKAWNISVQEVQFQGKKALQMRRAAQMGQGFAGYEFTLRAGEVLQSNGTLTGTDAVTWQLVRGDAQATFVPKTRFSLETVLPWAIGLIVVVGLAFGGYRVWLSRSQRAPMPAAVAYVGAAPGASSGQGRSEASSGDGTFAAFCPNCGAKQTERRAFCGECGNRLPVRG